jgi:hypothetical protein
MIVDYLTENYLLAPTEKDVDGHDDLDIKKQSMVPKSLSNLLSFLLVQ